MISIRCRGGTRFSKSINKSVNQHIPINSGILNSEGQYVSLVETCHLECNNQNLEIRSHYYYFIFLVY